MKELPQAVKICLWSYDLSKIDSIRDRNLIITQVLNHGTKEATDWLFNFYGERDIKKSISKPSSGMWNKKSLNLWSLIFLGKSSAFLPKRFV